MGRTAALSGEAGRIASWAEITRPRSGDLARAPTYRRKHDARTAHKHTNTHNHTRRTLTHRYTNSRARQFRRTASSGLQDVDLVRLVHERDIGGGRAELRVGGRGLRRVRVRVKVAAGGRRRVREASAVVFAVVLCFG